MPGASTLSAMDEAAGLSSAARQRLRLSRRADVLTAQAVQQRAAAQAAVDVTSRARDARVVARAAVLASRVLPSLCSGSGDESAESDTDHTRRIPAARPRVVLASTSLVTPAPPVTSAPSWLSRTRVFGGVPLGLGEEGVWVMATTAVAAGRKAKNVFIPRHYNEATASRDWPMWKNAKDAELGQMDVRKAF